MVRLKRRLGENANDIVCFNWSGALRIVYYARLLDREKAGESVQPMIAHLRRDTILPATSPDGRCPRHSVGKDYAGVKKSDLPPFYGRSGNSIHLNFRSFLIAAFFFLLNQEKQVILIKNIDFFLELCGVVIDQNM